MKRYIRKELRKGAKTEKDLTKKFKSILVRSFVGMRISQMIEREEIIECYGGYLILNN